jgi:hypothetical protein
MRAAPHRAVSTRVAALLLVALMALLLTGCRDSPAGADPIPWPAPSNQYAPLDDPSGYADEYWEYTDDPGTSPGDYTGLLLTSQSATPQAIEPISWFRPHGKGKVASRTAPAADRHGAPPQCTPILASRSESGMYGDGERALALAVAAVKAR